MILHWDQIVLHYGKQGDQKITTHQQKFEKAHQSTYGILYSPVCFDDCDVVSSGGAHAEAKLLKTNAWKYQIPNALENHYAGYNQRFNVIVGLNRSPCWDCTGILTEELRKLHRRIPLRADRNRFILACLGAYAPYETEPVSKRTTIADLTALRDAGWELCVLQTGDSLTRYGEMLKNSLESIGCRGIMRLDG